MSQTNIPTRYPNVNSYLPNESTTLSAIAKPLLAPQKSVEQTKIQEISNNFSIPHSNSLWYTPDGTTNVNLQAAQADELISNVKFSLDNYNYQPVGNCYVTILNYLRTTLTRIQYESASEMKEMVMDSFQSYIDQFKAKVDTILEMAKEVAEQNTTANIIALSGAGAGFIAGTAGAMQEAHTQANLVGSSGDLIFRGRQTATLDAEDALKDFNNISAKLPSTADANLLMEPQNIIALKTRSDNQTEALDSWKETYKTRSDADIAAMRTANHQQQPKTAENILNKRFDKDNQLIPNTSIDEPTGFNSKTGLFEHTDINTVNDNYSKLKQTITKSELDDMAVNTDHSTKVILERLTTTELDAIGTIKIMPDQNTVYALDYSNTSGTDVFVLKLFNSTPSQANPQQAATIDADEHILVIKSEQAEKLKSFIDERKDSHAYLALHPKEVVTIRDYNLAQTNNLNTNQDYIGLKTQQTELNDEITNLDTAINMKGNEHDGLMTIREQDCTLERQRLLSTQPAGTTELTPENKIIYDQFMANHQHTAVINRLADEVIQHGYHRVDQSLELKNIDDQISAQLATFSTYGLNTGAKINSIKEHVELNETAKLDATTLSERVKLIKSYEGIEADPANPFQPAKRGKLLDQIERSKQIRDVKSHAALGLARTLSAMAPFIRAIADMSANEPQNVSRIIQQMLSSFEELTKSLGDQLLELMRNTSQNANQISSSTITSIQNELTAMNRAVS